MFMKDLFHINSGMTTFVNFKEGAASQAAGVGGRAKAGTLKTISGKAFNLLTPAKQALYGKTRTATQKAVYTRAIGIRRGR